MVLCARDRIDRYEVIDLLGSGGMGEVYRARDPKLARLVALKILRVESTLGTEGAARLLREARATASLAHPNILAVYDVGEVQEPAALRGLAYIAMELVVGASLHKLLGDSSIPLSKRIDWMRDVANALVAAHDAGIVHRDIKPENIMVRRSDGVVKVLDFGIARRAATSIDVWSSTEGHSVATANDASASLPTLTGQGAIVGTPFYMAPEQLRGEVIDARADQFAWGVVAYALLTGKFPWPGGAEPLAVLSQILSLDPVRPCDIDPRISVGLSDVILRTLSKQREGRFASMGDVIDAIGSLQVEGTTGGTPKIAPAVPSTPVADALPAAPRARSPRLFAAAALVAAVAAAIGWGMRARRAASPPTVVATTTEPSGGACSSNAACVRAHGGGAWRCNGKRHACVEIASSDCTVYSEPKDLEADDTVWLGGMFPLHTDPGLLCESRAAELAREDFAAALGSSAGQSGPLHARPIGLVVCDEGADPMRAVKHLADDVEAPAVLGFRSTSSALSAISGVLLPARILSMVTISQAPDVTRIPEPAGQPRLVWRTTLDRVDATVPMARLISDVLEPRLRGGRAGIGSRPMKVAALWSTNANHDFVDGLFDALSYNGKSALDNGADFRQFVGGGDGGLTTDDLVSDMLAFEPQVVIEGSAPLFAEVLPRLEEAWGKSAKGPRPIYVTESSFTSAPEFAGSDVERRRRFFAVTNVSSTPTNAKLVLRYNLAYPSEPVTRTEAPQPSYDAFYALAYAVYALGDEPVTGPALAGALGRLLAPGRKIDVGPGGILDGFNTLRSGGAIDLNGAVGSLDFDPRTGEAPIDYAITCLGVDDHGRASATVDSGLVYDARAKKLVGVLRCP